MRIVTTLIISTALALPTMVQAASHKHKAHHAASRSTAQPRETVDDKGPYTPEANRAYNGGGMVLEGAPGGPPPPASAAVTPPGGRSMAPMR